MGKWLNTAEAAEYIGVKKDTLRKWVALGLNVPCYRYPTPTSQPRFKPADLDRWLERHRVEPRPLLRAKGLRRVK